MRERENELLCLCTKVKVIKMMATNGNRFVCGDFAFAKVPKLHHVTA